MDLIPAVGAEVFTSDGHALGRVTEVMTHEFLVEGGRLLKIFRLFPRDSVTAATDTRVDVTFDQEALRQSWHTITMLDHSGRERHVAQIGTPPGTGIPTYDEVQTTTGGPLTDESDV